MANAKFTINSTPSVNRGYDATHSAVLQLQLEDQPALDVFKCQFTIGKATAGAPTPTFSTSLGIASPPNGIVELTMPGSGVHLYEVICTVNNGVNADGRVQANFTFSRIVAIRSDNGFRKIMAAETTEYDPAEGWASAFNELAESITVNPPLVSNIHGTYPIEVDNSVPSDPVISIAAANTFTAGSMSGADKAKLDAATDLATVSTLVKRDSFSGGARFGTVSATRVTSDGNLVLSADGFGDITLDGMVTGELLVPMPIQSAAYKLDTETHLTRSIPLMWSASKVGGVSWSITDVGEIYNDIQDAFANLNIECDFPHGCSLTGITVRNKGAGGGGNPLPTNPPTFSLYRKSLSTGTSSLVATTNGTLDGTYRGNWRSTLIDMSAGTGHQVDASAYRYYLVVTPEFGIDSLAGCMVRHALVNYYFPSGYAIGLN